MNSGILSTILSYSTKKIGEASSDWLPGSAGTSVIFAPLLLVLLGTSFVFRKRSKNDVTYTTSIPYVRSLIPWLGSTLEVFRCPPEFSRTYRERYGDAFFAQVLGKDWLFVHTRQDVEAVVKASEKHVSMYVALEQLAGRLFPKEVEEDYVGEKARKILSRGNGHGTSSTHHFVFALKPHRLKSWIPGMRDTVVRHYFDEMPDSGRIDLFQFCFQLISGITARVLLGDAIVGNKEIGKKWIKMIQDADIDVALEGGIHSLKALLHAIINGERKEFKDCREFLYPYIDAEMDRCIRNSKNGIKQQEHSSTEMEDFPVLSGVIQSTFKDCEQDEAIFRSARRRIANDIILFTFAAVINSYGMAAWTLYYVLRNTAGVGDRIRKELQDSSPDAEHFPVLEAIILEIGRLYTPGYVHRHILRPFTLPSTGDTIPAGTNIEFNVAVLHRDKSIYSRPTELWPGRFLDGTEMKRAGASFFTFGAGMHPCVGRRFAILEIALFVDEALKCFEFEVDMDQNKGEDPFTDRYVTNVSKHPRLDPKQNNSIWRPIEPVVINYKRK